MGHGSRGLQSLRHRLGLLPPRPRPLARLSLERRRPRRHQRSPPAHLLCAVDVERPRRHSQGTPLRLDRQRGEPRRGRQGVLLLSRLDADALLHAVAVQVSAARVPVCRPDRGEPPPGPRPARIRADRHRRLRRRSILRRLRGICERRSRRSAHQDHRHQSRPGGGALSPRADRVVSQYLELGRHGRSAVARAGAVDRRRLRRLARRADLRTALALRRRPAGPAFHGERDQHAPPVRQRRSGLLQGRHQRRGGERPRRRNQSRIT
jgi:hypothetical protein